MTNGGNDIGALSGAWHRLKCSQYIIAIMTMIMIIIMIMMLVMIMMMIMMMVMMMVMVEQILPVRPKFELTGELHEPSILRNRLGLHSGAWSWW